MKSGVSNFVYCFAIPVGVFGLFFSLLFNFLTSVLVNNL